MTQQIIALASDHAGYALKALLKEELERQGYEVLDLGTDGPESVDYPDFGHAMGQALEAGRAERGVLVCGSGIGISIAAPSSAPRSATTRPRRAWRGRTTTPTSWPSARA